MEAICSDEELLRTRVLSRRRGIAGWPELTWQELVEVRGRYEQLTEEHLVLVAAKPRAANLTNRWSYRAELDSVPHVASA